MRIGSYYDIIEAEHMDNTDLEWSLRKVALSTTSARHRQSWTPTIPPIKLPNVACPSVIPRKGAKKRPQTLNLVNLLLPRKTRRNLI